MRTNVVFDTDRQLASGQHTGQLQPSAKPLHKQRLHRKEELDTFFSGAVGGGFMGPRLFKGADGKRQSQLVVWFGITSQISNIDSAPDLGLMQDISYCIKFTLLTSICQEADQGDVILVAIPHCFAILVLNQLWAAMVVEYC